MTDSSSRELDGALADVAQGRADRHVLLRLTRSLAGSARAAGSGAVASGRWASETLIELAPRIPLRDAATLSAQHGGLTRLELADVLIRDASRVTATLGAAAGALVSAEELAPPAWVAIPLELVVETLAVAAIEVKLVAEVHEAMGAPVSGVGTDRVMALVRSWAERRGVGVTSLARPKGVANALGRGSRNEVVRLVRRRLIRRMGRSTSKLLPLLVGAVAGAELNRRATRSVGEAIVADLR